MSAVSNFRWVGVFSFNAAAVGAASAAFAAAAIIGTSTGPAAGVPALFPP